MKWISHLCVAGAACAVFNPALVPVAMIGGLAPDWLEIFQKKLQGRTGKHRSTTHYLAFWLLTSAFFLFVWDWRSVGYWFCLGGVIHWICDSLNATGVPVGWWSDRRVHLAGGRLRFGSGAEYATVIVFVALCAAAIWSRSGANGFLPFFYQWGKYYEQGVVDGAEWRARRWDFI